jgi:hypothetical protein
VGDGGVKRCGLAETAICSAPLPQSSPQ